MIVKMKYNDETKLYDTMFIRDGRFSATVCDPFEAARIVKHYCDKFDFMDAKTGYDIMRLTFDETIVFEVDDKVYYEVVGRKW